MHIYLVSIAGMRRLLQLLMVCFGSLLLSDDFSCVEFDQHRAVCFQLFHRYTQSEVVEQEELQFEIVQFCQRQPADLRAD